MQGLSSVVLGILILSLIALSALAALGKVKARAYSGWLLGLTLFTGLFYLLSYVPRHAKAGEPVLDLANYFLIYSPIQALNQAAYVVPGSSKVWDTPAEVRNQVATLQSGDQVRALGRYRAWTHVRTPDGQDGWVNSDHLMNAATHEAEEQLRREMAEMPVQAAGHAADLDSVHIAPSRQAAVVAQVNPHDPLEILGRRMVPRPNPNHPFNLLPTVPAGPLEAWYLVRAGSHAGWILGHRVDLDIPQSISTYSQASNLVAWLVLNTVDDNGHPVPQYLVAERNGTEDCDFTGVRVLTWWKKKQTYAIAFKESGLQGFFPIMVTHQGSVPYFRVRLVDDDGAKDQKVYGLFDTMTRVIGRADNWQSDAPPEPRSTDRAQIHRFSARGSNRG